MKYLKISLAVLAIFLVLCVTFVAGAILLGNWQWQADTDSDRNITDQAEADSANVDASENDADLHLEEDSDTATGPSSAEPSHECSFDQPGIEQSTTPAQLLVTYFNAISDRDYETAFDLLSENVQLTYAVDQAGNPINPFEYFSQWHEENIACIRVIEYENVSGEITFEDLISASMGLQWYEVTFEAHYADAGSVLPAYYKLQTDPHADPGDLGLIVDVRESI